MNKKYIMITIISILILSIGASFAYWTARIKGEGTPMTFTSDEVRIIFDNKGNSITSNTPIEPGWSITKTFSVKSESDTNYNYNLIIKDLINTFKTTGFLQYKITSTNGYNMTEYKDIPKSETASDQILAEEITLTPNETHDYTIELRYIETDEDQSDDMGAMLQGTIFIEEFRPKTLYNVILADHKDVKTRTTGDFDNTLGGTSIDSSYDTTGVIYKESIYKEDGKDVYYFAGNPQDNWVKFAGFYWRIIRTNEDGSVRLLYAGTSPDTQTGYINNTTYTYSINSSTYDNTMYVGWKYGTSGSLANNRGYTNQGAAKAALDSWYSTNITGTNANMVSTDAIYCNDRSGGSYAATGTMYYAGYNRLYHNNTAGRQPSYKCGQNTGGTTSTSGSWTSQSVGMYSDASNADKFSKTTGSGGNGQLAYPVGLMTADEVAFAGGRFGSNAPNTYYYRNSRTGCTGASGDPCSVTGTTWWWTMSPYVFVNSYAYVFLVYGSNNPGSLTSADVVNTNLAVRPVVSLKSNVLVSGGNGTATNPYTVE